MNKQESFGLIVAGVGGQGALTLAQLALGAAWRSGMHVLQSEIHGMSQRGGEVSAHIVFGKGKISSPTIEEGTADMLLGLEPLETLRHVHFLKAGAPVISSTAAVINMGNYPDEEQVITMLKELDNITLIDSAALSKEIGFTQGGNMALLGAASKQIPLAEDIWESVIRERFAAKGEKIIEKNLKAFKTGRDH